MSHPETPERVEEVRRALKRLLEILAHEVAQEIVEERNQVPFTENAATSPGGANPSLDSDSSDSIS